MIPCAVYEMNGTLKNFFNLEGLAGLSVDSTTQITLKIYESDIAVKISFADFEEIFDKWNSRQTVDPVIRIDETS